MTERDKVLAGELYESFDPALWSELEAGLVGLSIVWLLGVGSLRCSPSSSAPNVDYTGPSTTTMVAQVR